MHNNLSTLPNLWSYFNKIYCINLYEREDRYVSCKNMFQNLGINNLEFYRTNKHEYDGKIGCFESHINVINMAYNSGANNCLIFEDDVYPLDFSIESLQECINFMETNNDWYIFYLGAFPNINYDQSMYSNHIYKTHSIGCHAYIVNKKLMEVVKDWKYSGIEIDNIFCKMNNNYAYYKPLFYQKASKSDISKRLWDTEHSDIFKKFVFRILNTYSYYIGFNLKKLVLIIIVCIILSVVISNLHFNK